ncbi:hypothetical protein Bca4012_008752 [Brassica carinata]
MALGYATAPVDPPRCCRPLGLQGPATTSPNAHSENEQDEREVATSQQICHGDIYEPCCCYTSRIKHHEPQHTPAARTRHAFELIEHSKALMARETEAAFRDTKEKTTAQALHAPHQSEPQGKSKSTIREPNRRAIKPPPRAITLARGLRDPPRSPKSRQHRIETSPSPRHDSTTHETTRALDPLSTEDRARSFPRVWVIDLLTISD